MSYFKLKFIQRVKKGKKNLKHVRFGLKIFATRQILKWNFYNASYFKLKFIQRVKKGKKNLKHVRFELKIFATRQILKWNFYIALQFELKFYNASDFTLKILTTCQNIKWKFHNTLDLDVKFLQRVRFEIEKFQHVRFGRKMHSKYHVLALLTPWNWHNLHFLLFFEKHDFELKNLQGVRLRIENFSKAEILTQ